MSGETVTRELRVPNGELVTVEVPILPARHNSQGTDRIRGARCPRCHGRSLRLKHAKNGHAYFACPNKSSCGFTTNRITVELIEHEKETRGSGPRRSGRRRRRHGRHRSTVGKDAQATCTP